MTARGDLVTKAYRGPDAARRQRREELAIRPPGDRLPVATIADSRPGELVLPRVRLTAQPDVPSWRSMSCQEG